LIDGLPVDALPGSPGGVWVLRLFGLRLLDLPVDLRVAELGVVRVPRIGGQERRRM
jgi:hypothetical protein